MTHIPTFEEFLNEGNSNWKIEDFPMGAIIEFKDGEDWIVVKPGMRHPSDRRKADEITAKPHNDLARKRNVSMGSDFGLEYLNKNVKNIKK
jgi:hypothetical protein